MRRTGRVTSSASLPSSSERRLLDLVRGNHVQLHELTIHEALAALRGGDISSVELTEAYLERIERLDPAVQAYLAVTAERARADAQRADQRRRTGDEAPLL